MSRKKHIVNENLVNQMLCAMDLALLLAPLLSTINSAKCQALYFCLDLNSAIFNYVTERGRQTLKL